MNGDISPTCSLLTQGPSISRYLLIEMFSEIAAEYASESMTHREGTDSYSHYSSQRRCWFILSLFFTCITLHRDCSDSCYSNCSSLLLLLLRRLKFLLSLLSLYFDKTCVFSFSFKQNFFILSLKSQPSLYLFFIFSALTSQSSRDSLSNQMATKAMEILTAPKTGKRSEKHGNKVEGSGKGSGKGSEKGSEKVEKKMGKNTELTSDMNIYDGFIFNSTQYLRARGLPSNSYSMNGTYARRRFCTYVLRRFCMYELRRFCTCF